MRNEESHFSVNPTNLDIGRSRFPRPFNHKTTFNVGQLIPFYWSEILPGDTVSMDTNMVVRMSTLLDPVMDNLYLDVYYFFVPMRLVWNHTKEFFGENTTGPWAPSTTYTIPQITCGPGNGVDVGSVADYMGIPTNRTGFTFNALPIRSYNKIYLDWFIDQMTMQPPNLFLGDSDQAYSQSTALLGGSPYIAAKLHDYFTSCTPAPQRGPSVSVPISGNVPVTVSGSAMNVVAGSSSHSMSGGILLQDGYLKRQGYIDGSASVILAQSGQATDATLITQSNLVTAWPSDASINLNGALPISVNDLRMAFQMQKWYEKSAMYGGRYIEMLKAQFGVTSPDARLQRSEYLGGKRIPLNVTQVEATANNSITGHGVQLLGDLGAYSLTSDSDSSFTHSFTEHGFLLGICCARYKHSYPQGLERAWSRKTMFDYYFPVFANIGNQPVLRKEIYLSPDSSGQEEANNSVFGYQEAWADYRYHPDRVSAYFRPGVSQNLATWHYADYYTDTPYLSADWMREDKGMVDRTLAVKSSQAPQLIADFYCDATFVRAMPLYSIPGLIDHH